MDMLMVILFAFMGFFFARANVNYRKYQQSELERIETEEKYKKYRGMYFTELGLRNRCLPEHEWTWKTRQSTWGFHNGDYACFVEVYCKVSDDKRNEGTFSIKRFKCLDDKDVEYAVDMAKSITEKLNKSRMPLRKELTDREMDAEIDRLIEEYRCNERQTETIV